MAFSSLQVNGQIHPHQVTWSNIDVCTEYIRAIVTGQNEITSEVFSKLRPATDRMRQTGRRLYLQMPSMEDG